MVKNLWKLICRPLPAWLTLVLICGGGAALAAGPFPIFYSGTASFGPGGSIDLGSQNASGTAPSTDPNIFAGTMGQNIGMQVPLGGVYNFLNCLNSGCSNLAVTAQFGPTSATFNEPVEPAPTGSFPAGNFNGGTPGPVPACFKPSGLACPASWHTVYATLNPVISGSCPADAVCNLRPGSASTAPLSGNANFNVPNGVQDVACSPLVTSNNMIGFPGINNAGGITVAIFNANTTWLADGVGTAIGFTCTGQ